jgi:Tfp pilus assembly protein FimT
MAGTLTLAAILSPAFSNLIAANTARTAARMVERELQSARLKAVSASRAMRVRLSCPAAGQLRMLEVTGVTATDTAADRCDPIKYPSPGPNDGLRATPSLDSPVIYLPEGTVITGTVQHFEFSPRGVVYGVSGDGSATTLAGEIALAVARHGWSHTVRINAIGRITID